MITVGIKALLGQLNPFCKVALERAAGMCVSRSHYEITVEHVFSQLLENNAADLALILNHYDISSSELKQLLNRQIETFPTGNTSKPVFSPRLMEWFQEAQLSGSVELGVRKIRSGTLILAFLKRMTEFSDPVVEGFLSPINRDELLKEFFTLLQGSVEGTSVEQDDQPKHQSGTETALGKYCEDFTRKARDGKIDPVFGRDTEIRNVVDILARRRKNNPILVGEAGVGKTAVVEGLALRIIEGDVPDFLKQVTLMCLDMGLLQAGAGMKGEFENRLKQVIDEVKASEKPVILFIDEAHTMIGAGGTAGGSDAANLLKPALARGELRTIAATTWSEYKKYFEKDAALARRFQQVHLEEPDVETATLILRGLREKYEQAHGVVIRDDALKAASELSDRYISGRYLPDKAIDLLDTSAARVKVLLTAKPGAVEALERQLQSLKREKILLERDSVYANGSVTGWNIQISVDIGLLEQELKETLTRWKKEQSLASRLIELKKTLYSKSLSERNADISDEVNEIVESHSTETETRGDVQGETEQTDDSVTEASASSDPAELSIDELRDMITEVSGELKTLTGKKPFVRTEVDPEIVAEVVSDWTGIPVGKMMHDDVRAILDIEENLKEHIIGQDKALDEISRIIRSSKAGLKNPEQPLGVFLLTGPSGVGKTETGLAVAELLFGGERSAVSINMSEFQEKHTVSRLIGSPPGYVGYGEGGVLTEAVRQRPYSVVLLDEAEKADHEVMNLFYQVFDKGILADGEGREISFKNTVVFLTSNLASDQITELIRNNPGISAEEIVAEIRPELSRHFKPALLARMSIVPFGSLDPGVMATIVTIKLKQVAERLKRTHGIRLEFSPEVTEQIAARCLEVETGARNIDHIMDATILPLLSAEVLTILGDEDVPEMMSLCLNENGAFIVRYDSEPVLEAETYGIV